MSLSASGPGYEYISLPPDNVGAIASGGFTIAMLYKPNGGVAVWNAIDGGYSRRWASVDDGKLYSFNDGVGFTPPAFTSGTWYWVVQTKIAGTAPVRWHVAPYGSSPTWAHGSDPGAAGFGDFTDPIDELTIGWREDFGSRWQGEWAVMAAWTRALTDGEIEAACTQAAQDTYDATPALLYLAPQAEAASPLVDVMDPAQEELSRTEGWSATADPDDYDFAIDSEGGGGGVAASVIEVLTPAGWVTVGGLGVIDDGTLLANLSGEEAAPTAVTLAELVAALGLDVADVAGAAPAASPTLTGTVTVSGRLVVTPDTLTDGSTIATDASSGNHFSVTVADDRVLGNPSNAVHGQRILFEITQDGTGGHSLTLGTKFNDPNGFFDGLSADPGATDYLGVIYHSGRDEFDVIAFAKGY